MPRRRSRKRRPSRQPALVGAPARARAIPTRGPAKASGSRPPAARSLRAAGGRPAMPTAWKARMSPAHHLGHHDGC
eukprot:4227053-Alexandrium_andersonii.AAC.1